MTDTTVRVLPGDRLAFGMQLPIQSQSTLYAAPWERDAGPEGLARVARAADDAGFFYVAVCDHTAIPERLAGTMGTVWYDTIATLGWLAAQTEQVHLLSHVYVLALRHPLRAAKEFATLDLLSGGRVIAGIGAGHVPEEYVALGGDFEGRGAATDEAVASLVAALTDEFPELPGPRWPAGGLGVAPRPVRSPRPPVWVGGSSLPALRRAARYADGWLPQTPGRRDLAPLVDRLRRLRAELRDGEPIEVGSLTEPIYVTDGGPPPSELPKRTLVGAPEQIAESLLEYAAIGVDQLQVRFPARSLDELCDQITLFGTQVGPLLLR